MFLKVTDKIKHLELLTGSICDIVYAFRNGIVKLQCKREDWMGVSLPYVQNNLFSLLSFNIAIYFHFKTRFFFNLISIQLIKFFLLRILHTFYVQAMFLHQMQQLEKWRCSFEESTHEIQEKNAISKLMYATKVVKTCCCKERLITILAFISTEFSWNYTRQNWIWQLIDNIFWVDL